MVTVHLQRSAHPDLGGKGRIVCNPRRNDSIAGVHFRLKICTPSRKKRCKCNLFVLYIFACAIQIDNHLLYNNGYLYVALHNRKFILIQTFMKMNIIYQYYLFNYQPFRIFFITIFNYKYVKYWSYPICYNFTILTTDILKYA